MFKWKEHGINGLDEKMVTKIGKKGNGRTDRVKETAKSAQDKDVGVLFKNSDGDARRQKIELGNEQKCKIHKETISSYGKPETQGNEIRVETKQKGIALSQSSEENNNLSHRKTIEKNYDILMRSTDINSHTVACLRAKNVIDDEQESELGAEKSTRKKLRIIYDWLKESEDKFMSFVSAMEENEQGHVANLLRENTEGKHVPISLKNRRRLMEVRPQIVKNITSVDEILGILLESRGISDMTFEFIRDDSRNELDKSFNLVTAIARRSEHSFECFRDALIQTKQFPLAKLLFEGEVTDIHVNTDRPELDDPLSLAIRRATLPLNNLLQKLNQRNIKLLGAKQEKSVSLSIDCMTVPNKVSFKRDFSTRDFQKVCSDIINGIWSAKHRNSISTLGVTVNLTEVANENESTLNLDISVDQSATDNDSLNAIYNASCCVINLFVQLDDNGLGILGAHPGHSIVFSVYSQHPANTVALYRLLKSGRFEKRVSDALNSLCSLVDLKNTPLTQIKLSLADKTIISPKVLAGYINALDLPEDETRTTVDELDEADLHECGAPLQRRETSSICEPATSHDMDKSTVKKLEAEKMILQEELKTAQYEIRLHNYTVAKIFEQVDQTKRDPDVRHSPSGLSPKSIFRLHQEAKQKTLPPRRAISIHEDLGYARHQEEFTIHDDLGYARQQKELKTAKDQIKLLKNTVVENNDQFEREKSSFKARQKELSKLLYQPRPGTVDYTLKLVGSITTKNSSKETPPIRGLAILDQELFIASDNSMEVEVYDSTTFKHIRGWLLHGLVNANDLAACPRNKCLYFSDRKKDNEEKELIRVDSNGVLVKKWSTGNVAGRLSVTDAATILFTVHSLHEVMEYSPEGQVIRTINLAILQNPLQAIKLPTGHIAVSHGITEDEMHRLCIVDNDGDVIKSFGNKPGSGIGQLNGPICLVVDSDGSIIVADCQNSRLVLLDSILEFKKTLDSPAFQYPVRVCLNQSNGRMFVVDLENSNPPLKVFDLVKPGLPDPAKY